MRRPVQALMFPVVTLVLAGILAGPPRPAHAAEAVMPPFRLEVGDVLHLRIEDRKEIDRQGQNQSIEEIHILERLEVVETLEEGLLIKTRTLAVDAVTLPPEKTQAFEIMTASFLDRDYFIESDIYGLPTRIRDWPLVADEIVAAMNQIVPEDLPQQVQQFLDSFTAMITQMDGAAAAQLAAENQTLWAAMNGFALVPGEAVPFQENSASPLTGDPIVLAGTVTLTDVDEDAGLAQVEMTQEATSESMEAMMLGFFRAVGLAQEQYDEVAAVIRDSGVRFSTRQVSLVELDTGWTRSVEFVKLVQMGPYARNLERKTITMERTQ
jgi:hypothetical protein